MCNASCGFCCGSISVFAIIFMAIMGLLFKGHYQYIGEFDEAVVGENINEFYDKAGRQCFMVRRQRNKGIKIRIIIMIILRNKNHEKE